MNLKKYSLIQASCRQRISPFPNYISMEGVTSYLKKVIGMSYKVNLLIFSNNVGTYFWDSNDHNRISDYIFKKILKDPSIPKKLAARVDKYGKDLIKTIRKFAEKDPSKYTEKQLAEIHLVYEKKYIPTYCNYFPVIPCEIRLIEYFKKYLKKISGKDDIEEYLNLLITEPRAQVNSREEFARLKLAKLIISNKVWSGYFNKSSIQETETLVKKDKRLNALFQKHTEDYFWITRDYEDPVLTYSDFIKRTAETLVNNPLKKLEQKTLELNELDKKRRDIIKKLGIDQYHSKLFAAMRESIHVKELRKTYVSQSLYYYDKVLFDIARRAGITVNEARHLKTDEIEKVFKDTKLKKELGERIKLSVFLIENGKTHLILGKEAQEISDAYCKVEQNITELKGNGVSHGKASGPVRIIMNPDEINKIKEGDILVSTQIVPSFAHALKKAVALVCDGGTGITSHSATLAREAKIPCVTGTKIATKILKDGDLVEVDANKGIIRKLNK